MNSGVLGIIGLLGPGAGGAVTAMDVAEEQIRAPVVEVQTVQGAELSN